MLKKMCNTYLINTIVTGPMQTIVIGIVMAYSSKHLLGAYLVLIAALNVVKLIIAYSMAISVKGNFTLVKRNVD